MSTGLARIVLAAVAGWGVLLSLLVASGRVPRPLAAPPESKSEAPCNCPEAKVTPDPERTQPPHRMRRYGVCGREERPARLFELGVGDPGLWAVHCGPSVHLLAFEPVEHGFVPRRVALLRAPRHSLVEAPRPGPIAALDVDGDDVADLLVGLLFADRSGAPRGGALYLVRGRPEGGFDAPVQLLDVAAGALAPAQLDGRPGADFVVLHRQDAHSGRANELWLVAGGPAPLRTRKLPASGDALALAALDIDADRTDDAVVLGSGPSAELWLSARPSEEPVLAPLGGAREALASDLDGDGARDLLVVGAHLSLVRVSQEGGFTQQSLAQVDSARDLQIVDANADARPDVVGYAHPAVVAWIQSHALRFERRELARVSGPLAVLTARVTALGAGSGLDLVLLGTSAGSGEEVELAVDTDLAPVPTTLIAADTAQPVKDAALTQRFDLP